MKKVIARLRQEEGNVESTLVIIPLLVLFLIAIELIITINYRNLDLSYLQSSASSTALDNSFSADDEVVSFQDRSSGQTLNLLISHQKRAIPQLIPQIPLLLNVKTHRTDVEAIAVLESAP